MRKTEIKRAIEAGDPLMFDQDANRSHDSLGRQRLVRVIREIPEGEEFEGTEAEKFNRFGRSYFRQRRAWRSEEGDPYYAEKSGWLVETVDPTGDLEPLSEILPDDVEPGEQFFTESRLLVDKATTFVDSARRKRETRLAEEENERRYGDVIEQAAGLGWVRFGVDGKGGRLQVNGGSHIAKDVDVADVLAAADEETKVSGRAKEPFGGIRVSALKGLLYEVPGERRFGEFETLGEARSYVESGFEVSLSVEDPDAIRALVAAARKERERRVH